MWETFQNALTSEWLEICVCEDKNGHSFPRVGQYRSKDTCTWADVLAINMKNSVLIVAKTQSEDHSKRQEIVGLWKLLKPFTTIFENYWNIIIRYWLIIQIMINKINSFKY